MGYHFFTFKSITGFWGFLETNVKEYIMFKNIRWKAKYDTKECRSKTQPCSCPPMKRNLLIVSQHKASYNAYRRER